MIRRPPRSTLFPLHDALPISLFAHSFTDEKIESLYKDMNLGKRIAFSAFKQGIQGMERIYSRNNNVLMIVDFTDRKSTRLNSSHANISYAVFCLKKNICEKLY